MTPITLYFQASFIAIFQIITQYFVKLITFILEAVMCLLKAFTETNQIFRPILTAKTWKIICMISEITIHLLPLTTLMMHLNEFTAVISGTIDTHAPLKPLSRKQRRLKSKPWLTKAICVSIHKKQSMFKSHFINDDSAEKSFFKKYSNRLTKIKTLSKKLHFKQGRWKVGAEGG